MGINRPIIGLDSDSANAFIILRARMRALEIRRESFGATANAAPTRIGTKRKKKGGLSAFLRNCAKDFGNGARDVGDSSEVGLGGPRPPPEPLPRLLRR